MNSYLIKKGLSKGELKETVEEFLSPNGVLYLVMNRPEVHNAFNAAQILLITEKLEKAQANPKVKVIVLAGEGKSFCAGGDINYMRSMGQNSFDENKKDGLALAKLMHTLYFLPKPTIARVQGAAFGGGVGLMCCCDIVMGTPDIKIGLSEVKIGVVASTISPYLLKALGTKVAKRFLLTAEILNAEKALRFGFISEISETTEIDEAIDQLTQTLLKNAPQAIQKTKSLILKIADTEIDQDLIDYTAESIANARASDEGKEGLSAFLEKRKPNWPKKYLIHGTSN